MNDELRALLSGYAAGTLTEEERGRLYQAALEDPIVFEAMADEQAMRDLLDDASARAELLAAVQDRPFSMAGAIRDWFERPKSKVLVAVALVLLVAIGVKQMQESQQRPRATEVAQVLRPSETQPRLPATDPVPPPARAVPKAAKPRPAEPKTSARTEAMVEAPRTYALAPPPPPPPPAKAEMPKPVAAPVLTWAVLRVDASGALRPVEPAYEFEAGEKARIRIEATAEGMLVARQGTEVLYAGTISPGLPVVLRRDIGFAEGDTPVVEVEWAPAMPVQTLMTSAAEPPRPRAAAAPKPQARQQSSDTASGVVGGVPGGVVGGVIGGVYPSTGASAFREGAVGSTIAPPPPPVRERLQIQLKRKNP